MREYIVPVDATYRDYEEMFIGFIRKKQQLIRCKDCKYLDVINSNEIYARCEKHGIEFLPFEDDTRKCFCSWAERV